MYVDALSEERIGFRIIFVLVNMTTESRVKTPLLRVSRPVSVSDTMY